MFTTCSRSCCRFTTSSPPAQAAKSYLVSPVYGSLKNLAPVTLFIGTRDILYPDCRKLRDKASAEGVRLDYREYDQMVHNWMLGAMPEAKHAIAEIVETISSNGRR